MPPLSLLTYIACNDIPNFTSTPLLFGSQRQTIDIRLSAYSNSRPFKSSVRPHLCGFSPYTASLHNHQQPTPLWTFPRLYVRTGFLLFSLAITTRSHDTATNAEGSLCVSLCGVTHSFEQHHISCINSFVLRRALLTPPHIRRRNVSPHGTHLYRAMLLFLFYHFQQFAAGLIPS